MAVRVWNECFECRLSVSGGLIQLDAEMLTDIAVECQALQASKIFWRLSKPQEQRGVFPPIQSIVDPNLAGSCQSWCAKFVHSET